MNTQQKENDWLTALSSAGLLHDSVPIGEFGLQTADAKAWSDHYRAQGLEVKQVSKDEHRALVRRSESASKEIEATLPTYIDGSNPVVLSLDDLRKTPNGLRAVIRYGECFDGRIEWTDHNFGMVVFAADCNLQGEAGVVVTNLAGRIGGIGFAGFDPRTKIWWRYANEAVAAQGEHCMQVLALV